MEVFPCKGSSRVADCCKNAALKICPKQTIQSSAAVCRKRRKRDYSKETPNRGSGSDRHVDGVQGVPLVLFPTAFSRESGAPPGEGRPPRARCPAIPSLRYRSTHFSCGATVPPPRQRTGKISTHKRGRTSAPVPARPVNADQTSQALPHRTTAWRPIGLLQGFAAQNPCTRKCASRLRRGTGRSSPKN